MLTLIFTLQMGFTALHKEAFFSFEKGVSWLCKSVAKKCSGYRPLILTDIVHQSARNLDPSLVLGLSFEVSKMLELIKPLLYGNHDNHSTTKCFFANYCKNLVKKSPNFKCFLRLQFSTSRL